MRAVSVEDAIGPLESARLSHYQTRHRFRAYAEFRSAEEFAALRQWACDRGLPIFILGNGSNTWFTRKRVRTLVARNRMPAAISELPDGRVRISSSTRVADVLRHCLERSLDSFYYLASVPAEIGGALAMNAGRGESHQVSIFDFVETVRFLDRDGETKTWAGKDVVQGFRRTLFTGVGDRLILDAVFRFPRVSIDGNPIKERIAWSHQNQDYRFPSCGSVFRTDTVDMVAMRALRGLRIGGAWYSPRTFNWICNRSQSPLPIRLLILAGRLRNRLRGKKALLEVVAVR
ncbi:MAG: FAD-binding protein [Myxococcota bacterium]|nr:FAD-binding protein [Myxococcota bacterium]